MEGNLSPHGHIVEQPGHSGVVPELGSLWLPVYQSMTVNGPNYWEISVVLGMG